MIQASLSKSCRFRVGAALLYLVAAANGSDLAREAKLRDALLSQVATPNRLVLEADGREFLAVYRRASSTDTKGAVILLPGRGAHPESRMVIRLLATGLTDHGWDTLALQLPIPFGGSEPDWSAVADQAIVRITAALAFLRQRGIGKRVLLGHDFGAITLMRYLSEQAPGSSTIAAGVLVGMPIESVERKRGALGDLRKIRLPLLDLYGTQDLPEVHQPAKERALAARDARNLAYRQRVVPGADHWFTGTGSLLLRRVSAWLTSVPDRTIDNSQ